MRFDESCWSHINLDWPLFLDAFPTESCLEDCLTYDGLSKTRQSSTFIWTISSTSRREDFKNMDLLRYRMALYKLCVSGFKIYFGNNSYMTFFRYH